MDVNPKGTCVTGWVFRVAFREGSGIFRSWDLWQVLRSV